MQRLRKHWWIDCGVSVANLARLGGFYCVAPMASIYVGVQSLALAPFTSGVSLVRELPAGYGASCGRTHVMFSPDPSGAPRRCGRVLCFLYSCLRSRRVRQRHHLGNPHRPRSCLQAGASLIVSTSIRVAISKEQDLNVINASVEYQLVIYLIFRSFYLSELGDNNALEKLVVYAAEA